jgi:plastocyanin
MSARRVGVVAAALVAFGIAGCGGGNDDNNGGPTSAPAGAGERLSLRADPTGRLRFDKKTLQAKAGKVTIIMSNPAPVSHDVSIEGAAIDEHGEVVGEGGTSRVTADLKPGTYTFYCSVPGHREAGMQGTLTVK